jgi:hypothetical protein
MQAGRAGSAPTNQDVKDMPKPSIKIWFRHLGISVLGFIVMPATIFVALAWIPGAQMAGLTFGAYYYSISYYLFGDLLGLFREALAPLPQKSVETVAVFGCWLLVCIVIASLQSAVAWFRAKRALQSGRADQPEH